MLIHSNGYMVCVEMQLNVNLELLSRCASVSVIGTDTVTMALRTAYVYLPIHSLTDR